MTPILISILILAIVAAALIVSARQEAKKHPDSKAELTTGQAAQSGIIDRFVGICEFAIETASQKEARKQKALAMFEEGKELSNAEIRKALGVSSRTAVRYLDELEYEGKVEQVGKVGQAVTYRLK